MCPGHKLFLKIQLLVLHDVAVFRVEREGVVKLRSLDHKDVVQSDLPAATEGLHAGQNVSKLLHLLPKRLAFTSHLLLKSVVEVVIEDVVGHLPGPQHLSVRVGQGPHAVFLSRVELEEHDVLGVKAGASLEQHERLLETLHHHHEVQLTVKLLEVHLHGLGVHLVEGRHARVQCDGVVQLRALGHRSLDLVRQSAGQSLGKLDSEGLVGLGPHAGVVEQKVLSERNGQQVVVVVGGGEEARQGLAHDGAVEGVCRHEAGDGRAVEDHVVEEDVVLLAFGNRQ